MGERPCISSWLHLWALGSWELGKRWKQMLASRPSRVYFWYQENSSNGFYRILNGVIRLGLSVCGHEHNENSLYSHSSSLLWGRSTDCNRIQGFRHARQLVLCHWAPLTLLETVFYWVVLIAFLILMYILLLNYNKVRYIVLFNKIIEIWQFKYKIIKERLILFLGKLKQK